MLWFIAVHSFLLASAGQTTATALALLGTTSQHSHHNNRTTPIINKRQGTAIITKYFTIFGSGDATNIRTANPGFDIRVDLLHDIWGFCPTSVIAATDCGLAGSCVDRFRCTKGCGFPNGQLTTFTW
ncbi:hypothetical protein N656DRAFT_714103 [Canariomyces notabilis]|uniref:Uncharacterized protein n=1 Tax=Canariomyces notabilis TaxID=2074819 RepID=A0AAN6QL86_9PEZI|nr:hypothetical protein N656DRAFT_714103 [Canariomyces arenarius]